MDAIKYRDVFYNYLLDDRVFWVYDAMRTLVALAGSWYRSSLMLFLERKSDGRNIKYFTIKLGYPTKTCYPCTRAASSRMHYTPLLILLLLSQPAVLFNVRGQFRSQDVHNHITNILSTCLSMRPLSVFQHLTVCVEVARNIRDFLKVKSTGNIRRALRAFTTMGSGA